MPLAKKKNNTFTSAQNNMSELCSNISVLQAFRIFPAFIKKLCKNENNYVKSEI